MRIAYLLTTTAMGGAERQAILLAERMAARGNEVRLYAMRSATAEQWTTSLPVQHFEFEKSPADVLAGTLRGLRALRAFDPDLLHAHCFHANLFARIAGGYLPSTRVIATVHNVFEGGRIRMLAYRMTDRLAARTVFVCSRAAQKYVEQRVVASQKSFVLHNGIDTEFFVPNAQHRNEVRSTMGVKAEFVWISVGRLVPAKNYENLLRAWSMVSTRFPDACLWIVGEGNGTYAASLQALGSELRIEGSVRWLGKRTDIASLLNGVDGFVLASAWEGMPLAVGEAMAMGRPVVATDVGGVSELVGECGKVVVPGDANALAGAMQDVMHLTEIQRADLGRRARLRIVQEFGIETSVAAWERLYASVLNA